MKGGIVHELSLVRQIFQIIARQSLPAGQIRKVYLRVGLLSGVDAPSLAVAFDAVKGELGFSQAQLVINWVEALGDCSSCQGQFAVKQRFAACPACQHFPLTLRQGDEFLLDKLEVR